MKETKQITFERYDFVLARKTVKLEKGDNREVYIPDDYKCRISATGIVPFEYTSGGMYDVVYSKCKENKSAIPSSITVSLYRNNVMFEVPFKGKGKDLAVLLIKIVAPEKVEGLLEKIPHNKYVEGWQDGEWSSYLFKHYDIEHHARGLADFVHEEMYDSVMAGKNEEIGISLKAFGMEEIEWENR